VLMAARPEAVRNFCSNVVWPGAEKSLAQFILPIVEHMQL
jgi:hypothetical protein